MEWISVNDRLPEDNNCVLIFFNNTFLDLFGVGKLSHNKWHTEFYGFVEDSYTPSHWMPLPPEPKTN